MRANRLVALAVTSPTRSSFAPEVPTLIESGVNGVNVPSRCTLVAPTRTPHEVADKLRAGLKRITSNTDFREQLARQAIGQAIDVRTLASNEFADFLRTEIPK